MNKYYILNSARPIGVYPEIHLSKPNLHKEIVIDEETGEEMTDYWFPEIEEYSSIKDALNRIVEFNDTDEYLKHLRIVE